MADKTKKAVTDDVVTTEVTEETAVNTVAAKKPKKEEPKPAKKYVELRVPMKGKEDTMFVGVNFKNYILKRGEFVRVPEEVAEVIRNAEKAEERATAFAISKEKAYFEKAANPIAIR